MTPAELMAIVDDAQCELNDPLDIDAHLRFRTACPPGLVRQLLREHEVVADLLKARRGKNREAMAESAKRLLDVKRSIDRLIAQAEAPPPRVFQPPEKETA